MEYYITPKPSVNQLNAPKLQFGIKPQIKFLSRGFLKFYFYTHSILK